MENPAFHEDMLKIGYTKHDTKRRAKELFTTGVPDKFSVVYKESVPDCVSAEKLIHNKLKQYRHRKDREFFILPLYEAISIVQKVIREEIHGDTKLILEGTHRLYENTTYKWTCYSKGIILLIRYSHWLSEKPTIANILGCKIGDQILLTNRIEDDIPQLNELAKKSYLKGHLSDIIDIYPGDRLAIIGSPKPNFNFYQMSLFEQDLSTISILDCWAYAKMIAFMEYIEILPDGLPRAFGDNMDEKPPEAAHQAFQKILEMGFPDVFHNLEYVNRVDSGNTLHPNN